MFELLITVLFLWLMVRVLGLFFRLTWGLAKVAACVLMVLAAPVLLVCLLFAGGIVLLIPLGLIAAAWGIVRACT